MYLNQFPDINWIRKAAKSDFQDGRDYQGNPLPQGGWPTAIINVKSSATERNEIKGPFSLFYNLSGSSLIKLNNTYHRVTDCFYCTSNKGEFFDLHIPEAEQTTTFNIHFGQQLYDDVLQNLTKTEEWSLDNFGNLDVSPYEVLPTSRFINESLERSLQELHGYVKQSDIAYSSDKEFELTGKILKSLLLNNNSSLRKFNRSGAKKLATKLELFKRVNMGLEFIHSHNLQQVDLEGISRSCGLSKFHFIRVFQEFYGKTPGDYISELRLIKAQRLLKTTDRDLNSISAELGFSELSAFSRFFKRLTGKNPSSGRQ